MALRQGIAREAVDNVVVVDVLAVWVLAPIQSPPAALRQGIARDVVDREVAVAVLDPVTTRGPQTGNRAGGSQPCSRG
jgi:hypothetical protein